MLRHLEQRECRPFTGKERLRLLRKDRDKRGVASTVGTIMALLVFLTFLALFTNSYIPVWMLDNERTHMNEVDNQFGDLKGKVDNMVVMASTTGTSSLNMFAPITLGANGIPIFAAATAGQLTYCPFSVNISSIEVNFKYNLDPLPQHQGLAVDERGGGAVQLYCPNRYYVEQWVCYENGAILVKQSDGQLVRAIPSLEATKTKANGFTNLSFTQFDFIGKNSTITGTGVAGISIDLVYLDEQTYINHTALTDTQAPLSSITLTVKTQYGRAWGAYLNDTFASNGLTASDFSITQLPKGAGITIVFHNVWKFEYNIATFDLAVTNG